MQKTGKVNLPEGKTVAVNIGCDFDAQSIWDGSFNMTSPAYQARGEFGAEVAAPRLLKLFDKYGIKTTWCIPGHTADTFPTICKQIVQNGHEVAHHGYVHENPTTKSYEEEDKVIAMGLESLKKIGVTPRGYRSPYWDFSPNTLSILEKHGFEYDSSLMANDLHPYYPRPVEVNSDKANVLKKESNILELPVSWYLDDFPAAEYINGKQEGMNSVEDIYKRWTSIFDYACENKEGACFILTIHPQTSGRAHMIQMLEKLINYMDSKGAWFTTLENIYDNFEPNNE
ncbi:polysaccharide deacetylase family protein [Staphylococcus shinii]|uniref:polysaccharide deacetylase family protein n=1 Tax=Staphylococcus shinii TaxID=2912228 RepID=UPI000E68A99A|nr:polysaccharide deacetylase [Staphylococcus shinii]RIN07712.1 polysaccharide deacetylase [Staphylococcus shinii]